MMFRWFPPPRLLQTDYSVKIDEEKALSWMAKGAQPTDTVKNLFSKDGIMKKYAESKAK